MGSTMAPTTVLVQEQCPLGLAEMLTAAHITTCWSLPEPLRTHLLCYVGPQQLPMLWFHVPNRALVSDTSNRSQNDVGNYSKTSVLGSCLGACEGCARGPLGQIGKRLKASACLLGQAVGRGPTTRRGATPAEELDEDAAAIIC